MHARLDRGVVRLLTARVRLDAQIPGRSPRRWRRFPPGKPISTRSWAAFNRMAQPSFSLLQSASDSGNSENLIFLLFDLPPARWRNRRREPARRAEGAAPYTLVGCAALAKATPANSSRTRVFGQVPVWSSSCAWGVRQRSPSREPLLRSSRLHPRCRVARLRRIAPHNLAPYAQPRTAPQSGVGSRHDRALSRAGSPLLPHRRCRR